MKHKCVTYRYQSYLISHLAFTRWIDNAQLGRMDLFFNVLISIDLK